MKLSHQEWTIEHLQEHLQDAVALEFWTIPFYMSCMYSIKDKSLDAYQLIRTVVNQEMLHLQCAANIANAYGLSPKINPPIYVGTKIPFLDFSLDPPEVIKPYLPYTAEIGPLDLHHINAMCLIEIPDYETQDEVHLFSDTEEYGSIGAFYAALRKGAALLKDHVKGGINQIDFFSSFYRNMPEMKITNSGIAGHNQVDLLIDLITEQGEGQNKLEETIPHTFQNTADDTSPEEDHFAKFNQIKSGDKPDTFPVKDPADYSPEDHELQEIAFEQFNDLRAALEALFSGQNPDQFFAIMASVGASLRNCWQHGVTPKFS